MLMTFTVGNVNPFLTTLAEAQDYVRAEMSTGVKCPCCNQLAKVYKRLLTESHIKTMMAVYREQCKDSLGERWVYLPDIPQRSRDFATVAYFGLAEQHVGQRDDGSKSTGWWRITTLGADFLAGKKGVQKYALVYDGKVIDHEGLNVYVGTVSKGFNFRELMRGD
jgi:hypothetical protein